MANLILNRCVIGVLGEGWGRGTVPWDDGNTTWPILPAFYCSWMGVGDGCGMPWDGVACVLIQWF
ncbi:predicted protein [Plenodomus lingam JN3]|uniref:Predicted protein n=1 Tax=Leptosphaeria maculans (strain JN3 / isolate v23.1.3 / race Av1-4-5-6-7-8) TaxID=985895 RepID=E4ZLE5_LEPMJ|nr:predicted protein [Plenodomus lingam JN3]CBX92304.1 predicted protein [Plenodomus lingam JN3]